MHMSINKSREARTYLVAIVGGSGSGKSWLGVRLKRLLGRRTTRISLDDFYHDRSDLTPAQRCGINFDNPAAIDWPLFQHVLNDLSQGRSTRSPLYSFASHCRRAKWRTIKPNPIILVDGLWLLRAPSLRRYFHFTIFLRCCRKVRLQRRLERDMRSRSRTRESVLEQFRTTVQPMHRRFVEPQERWATIVLDESFSEQEIQQIATRIEQELSAGK